MSFIVGGIRLGYLLQRGRKLRSFDLLIDPCMALLAGMLIWAILEVMNVPDVLQAAMTSLGAWGGPRTVNALEVKYISKLTKDED